jgi:transcriptional regulator with XRE-family HTH domain
MRVPHSFAHIGEELKARREMRGISLAHMASTLRISKVVLHAIERLDEDNLPVIGYAIGYARAYGKELGMPGDLVVERFKADLSISQIASHQGPKQRVKPRPIALPKGIFSGIAVSLFAGSLAVWFGVQADAPSYQASQVPALPADIYRLTATQPSLVEIRSRNGEILLRRILTPGQTWQGDAQAGLTLSARNGNALTLERGAVNFGPLALAGQTLAETRFSSLETKLSDKVASR